MAGEDHPFAALVLGNLDGLELFFLPQAFDDLGEIRLRQLDFLSVAILIKDLSRIRQVLNWTLSDAVFGVACVGAGTSGTFLSMVIADLLV